MVKIKVEVLDPPYKHQENESFNKDKYIFVIGTSRVRRRHVRVKVFK